MKANLFAACAAAILVAATAGAAERPIKKKPADTKAYDESKKEFKEGEKVERTVSVPKQVPVTKTVKVGNEVKTVTEVVTVMEQQKVVVVIPKRMWMIGAQGWHDDEGYNIDNLVSFNVNNALVESPLARIAATVNNKNLTLKLEPQDVITRIDGQPVTTELDLFLAIHQAANPRKLAIEFIDHKDGTVYSGTVSAMKVK